jgi:DNA ligase D-like protein (predicted 3'-phosphoesterase)
MAPSTSASTLEGRYVVHKHAATHLHYDLRLELDGVLKSWAVPKGLPEEKGLKRLAIAVEDHPLEYADFEGVIPKGEYGAGTVEIWDSGTFQLLSRKPKMIEFELKAKKLRGVYEMINTRGNQWLLFKKR